MNIRLLTMTVCAAALLSGGVGCGQNADHKPTAADTKAFQGDASKMPDSVRQSMKNMSGPPAPPAPANAPK